MSQANKRCQHGVDETPKKKKRQKSSGKPPTKVASAKKAKATPKKRTPVKKVLAPPADTDLPASPLPAQTSTPVNAHRAKILVAKQALAVIKAGTRKDYIDLKQDCYPAPPVGAALDILMPEYSKWVRTTIFC